jgi:methyl-accepting chemotaxis protein
MEASRRRRLGATGDVLVLVLVIVALVGTGFLLNNIASQAGSIEDNTDDIAELTAGINEDTTAILLLDRTNELAASILESARPLDEKLATTVDRANSIDRTVVPINDAARSINETTTDINATAGSIEGSANNILGTARSINETAGDINTTAGNINTLAAAILDVAGRINVDVKRINLNLNGTIEIVESIRKDTQRLVVEGRFAHKEAACIDREVNVLITQAYEGGEFCERNVDRDR